MSDPYAGVEYFPQTLPVNTVVGRLGNIPGPAEAIPFATLAKYLAPVTFATTAVLLSAYPSTLTDGQTAQTFGRTTLGDHGGGQFQYVASDTTTVDNGGTIRVDNAGHRWYYISPNAATPELFGAKGNAITSADAKITSGQHRVTDTSAAFTAADVGKVYGLRGAGAAGGVLITTISAYVDATHVDLTAAASTTVSSTNDDSNAVYGTDDAVALAAFFAERAGKYSEFSPRAVGYLSTVKLVDQSALSDYRKCPLIFLIGNNTDNCIEFRPPQYSVNGGEDLSKFTRTNVKINAMATGLDAVFINDGQPTLPMLHIENSYRDAMLVRSNGVVASAGSIDTYIENMTGFDWHFGACGRHALHLYLSGDGVSATIPVFINESNMFGFEIRGVGRRFTGSNAVRITYDNTDVALLAANKVEHFYVYGANWDCQLTSSLGGAGVGDVIYHNVINGATARQVEQFRLYGGGVENTQGGAVTGSPKLLNGNALVAGDWLLSHIECEVYQWGFGVIDTFLSSPADNNTFHNTTGTFGASGYGFTYLPFIKRPVDGRSIISSDPAPIGGIIDANFKNSLTPWVGVLTLTASSTATVDIPIQPVPKVGNSIFQWPIKVIVSINPYNDSTSYWAYGEFTVLLTYDTGSNTVSVAKVTGTTKVPGDVTVSFTPASDVSFSVVSSSGTLRDRLRVSIAGGANVGSAGANTKVAIAASRWGFGLSEAQRSNIAVASEFTFKV